MGVCISTANQLLKETIKYPEPGRVTRNHTDRTGEPPQSTVDAAATVFHSGNGSSAECKSNGFTASSRLIQKEDISRQPGACQTFDSQSKAPRPLQQQRKQVRLYHFSDPSKILGVGGFGLVTKVIKLSGTTHKCSISISGNSRSSRSSSSDSSSDNECDDATTTIDVPTAETDVVPPVRNITSTTTPAVAAVDYNNNKDDEGVEYAMKSMSKAAVLKRSSGLASVTTELKCMVQLQQSQYICKLRYAFQDGARLHMILEYASGGDMRHVMRHHCYTSEKLTNENKCGIYSSILNTTTQPDPHHSNQRQGHFNISDARYYIAQVFLALHHCHALNILHRGT